MKRLHVLVEGQTEETFVRDVLAPHLQAGGVTPIPVLLKTKRVKSGGAFRGGVTSSQQVIGDLRRLLRDTEAVAITTVIDYYGLPSDFPGMATRPSGADPYSRVAHVESELADVIGDRRFIPHLTLHEYEAWIYSEPAKCAWVFSDSLVPARLEAIRDQHGGAERINETQQGCPSKRLLKVYPPYQKTLEGPMAVGATGLGAVRAACPHVGTWLGKLESL